MKLRPESAVMTVMLAVLISIGPLSTDMYLPSLPWIARDLGASDAGTQLTLSLFLVGIGVGQTLSHGPWALAIAIGVLSLLNLAVTFRHPSPSG